MLKSGEAEVKRLFSVKDNDFLQPVIKKEDVLRDFLWNNRKKLFQEYNFIFIAKEFSLNEGQVHDSCKMGRIDILAYNPDKKRFVIFELKATSLNSEFFVQSVVFSFRESGNNCS